MSRPPLPSLVLTLLLALSTDGAVAASQPQGPAPTEPEATPHRQAILDALPGLSDHPWAGTYGDGMHRVSVAPGLGVSAFSHGCLGVYGQGEGEALEQPDGSILLRYDDPAFANEQGFPGHLVPVRWGERHYLLSADKLLDFVDQIQFGDEPRSRGDGALLRFGDECRRATGLPTLPMAYALLLRSERGEFPIRAVTEVARSGEPLCRLTQRIDFDPRGDTRLRTGMKLKVLDTGLYDSVRIVEVGADHAVALREEPMAHDCADLSATPRPGMLLVAEAVNVDRELDWHCEDPNYIRRYHLPSPAR